MPALKNTSESNPKEQPVSFLKQMRRYVAIFIEMVSNAFRSFVALLRSYFSLSTTTSTTDDNAAPVANGTPLYTHEALTCLSDQEIKTPTKEMTNSQLTAKKSNKPQDGMVTRFLKHTGIMPAHVTWAWNDPMTMAEKREEYPLHITG